ncbi:MAG: ABC-F family ATP-binding cassette domain-containing protein [Verrucomicrobia bacterium]|nr:ABC-F family ATP-binding cassette domain-containing protein [Verrucomicrobiota bacterium]
MIKLEKIVKAYGADQILDGIDTFIGKHEKCGLVGRNGAGKTTLFRLICGLEEPDSGTITIPKQYRLGYLSQHIDFKEKTVLEEACLGLPAEQKEMTYKAEAILFGLGFQKADLEKAPKDFSGGYQLRIHLTKLLLSEPDCLLLDEPTNYLDILSIRWLRQFLQNWDRELLIISHDREFLDSIVTHTIGIHRKTAKKVEGPSEKFYHKIAQEEEVYEKTRTTLDKKRKAMESFITRFGAKASKAGQAQSRVKALAKLPALEALCEIANLSFTFPAAPIASKIILKGSGLSFSYTDSPLISGLSFEIENGARIGVIGKNGKGKSTFLRLLIKELEASTGLLTESSNLQIGYFGQSHINRLNLDATVEEEIQQANPKLTIQEARSIAGKMMFTQSRAEKKIGVLSGGERSRVVLGKLLARPCNLLLLDEPTNHLDVESLEAFMDALEQFDGAVVIVTHSELVLDRLATELFVFREHRQELFRGSYSEFLEKGGWSEEDGELQRQPAKKEMTYKDAKKRRADLTTERSRALKPLLTRQTLIENQIIQLEAEVTSLNNKMIEDASGRQIGELSKSAKEKQNLVETLFTELEELHDTIERVKKEYDLALEAACG